MLRILLRLGLLLTIVLLLACNPSTPDEPTKTDVTLTLLAGQDTIAQHSPWHDAGVRVEGEEINTIIYTSDFVDTQLIGLVRVTYQYTHEGETFTIDRYIMVTDPSPLSIELLPGVDTISLGETWQDAGVNVAPGIEVSIQGTVNIHRVGTYEIVYTITNSAGQSFSVKRIVTVID